MSAARTTRAVVAASRLPFSCSSPKVWPREKSTCKLHEQIAQARRGRNRLVVADSEDLAGLAGGPGADRALGARSVDLLRRLGAPDPAARALGELLAADRAERGLQRGATGVVLREVEALPLADVAVEAVRGLLQRADCVGHPRAKLRVLGDLDGGVVEAENRIDRVVEPAADDEQADHGVDPDTRAQRTALGARRARARGRMGRAGCCCGFCHRIAPEPSDSMHKGCRA